jgi:hypothetical protein
MPKKGYKFSEEHNKKISNSLKNAYLLNPRPAFSEEHRKKIGIKSKGRIFSEDSKLKMSKSGVGRVVSEETRKKISEGNKGKKKSSEHIKNLSNSHKGLKQTQEQIAKRVIKISGELSGQWKGGITPINHKIRTSLEYKLCRTAVYERDNYTCVWCGQRGGKLNADHIKPFCLYPELRFAIDNGRTLCVDCHKKIGWNLFRENNPVKKITCLI